MGFDLETWLVITMFASLMAMLLIGIPVAWALGGTALLFAVLGHLLVEHFNADIWFTWSGTMGVMPQRLWGVVANELLVAIPMFIFMGIMLDRSGIAERLMHNLARVFGRIRGGYAITVVVLGVLLAATTGIIGASVVLLGMLALGPMLSAKYSPSFAVGTTCSVGTLGILLPPSIMLVIMAERLGTPEASVGNLFMGALIPGLLLGGLYILYIVVLTLVRPSVAPAVPQGKLDLRALLGVAWAVIPPAALIVLVLGSIFFGFATTTEASGVGALGATLLALANGKLSLRVLQKALYETSKTAAFIFGIFIGATIFASVLRGLGGDDVVRDFLTGLPFSDIGIIMVILAVVFLLGFFLDWLEITLIILPLVAPVVMGMGFDPVWFAVLFAVCLQTSFLTPPVGFALFYIKGVCPPGIGTRDIYAGVVPFIIIQLIGLALVFYFEPLATWLPREVYGGH